MSGQWTHSRPNATIVIDAGRLSALLGRVGTRPVDELAWTGYAEAINRINDVRAEAMIGLKRATQSPVGSYGFPLESGRLNALSRMLRIPVALVTNDSLYAVQMEVGGYRPWGRGRRKVNADRPLLGAYAAMKARPGVRGIRAQLKNSAPDSFRGKANAAWRAAR